MSKTYQECSYEESMAYVEAYFATVDLIADALYKYDLLASDAPTGALRSYFRARSLEAQRDLELLKNKRRAFLNGTSRIRPPSQAVVDAAVERAERLAEILAEQAQADAIIQLATDGLKAFAKIQAA